MPILKLFSLGENKYKTKSNDEVIYYFVVYAKRLY